LLIQAFYGAFESFFIIGIKIKLNRVLLKIFFAGFIFVYKGFAPVI